MRRQKESIKTQRLRAKEKTIWRNTRKDKKIDYEYYKLGETVDWKAEKLGFEKINNQFLRFWFALFLGTVAWFIDIVDPLFSIYAKIILIPFMALFLMV